MGESQTGAALVVDVGTARTKAALFDVVEGARRFVAGGVVATTLHGSHDDVSTGVRAAIAQIEEVTGRRLLGPSGPILPQRSDGNGVDVFASTSSLGDQLRLLLLAEDSSSHLSRLVKTSAETHGADLEIFSPGKNPDSAPGNPPKTLLAAIDDFDPHVLVLVGQHLAGPNQFVGDLVETISKELKRSESTRPAILLVGSTADGAVASRALHDRYDLRIVSTTDEEPSPEVALRIAQELTRLWQERIIEDVPGYSLVISWQNQHVLPSALAIGGVLSFVSNYYDRDVVGVDVGASGVSVFRIQGDKQEMLVARNVGVGCESLIDSLQNIQSWLPIEVTKEELANSIWNKWIRPWSIPSTTTDGYLETAYAAVSLKQVCRSIPGGLRFTADRNRGLLVGTGVLFTRDGRNDEVLMALLDGIEPSGVFEIGVDRFSILPQLGALGAVDPQAAAEVIGNDGLALLASCLACDGSARGGSPAVKLEFKNTSGKGGSRLDIPFGRVTLIAPLRVPQGEVSVKVVRGADAGWGRGKGGKASFQPGQLGLAIDTRGRPLQVPRDGEQVLGNRKDWLGALSIPEEQRE